MYILIALICIVLVAVIRYFQNAYTYWEKKGVHSLPPTIPFGNMADSILARTSPGNNLTKLYFEFKRMGHKFAGIYFLSKPVFFPLDPDLIKHILTKDFHNFTDRGFYIDEENDPLSAHLFSLSGTKWKNLRSRLSPAFSSGKLKGMFPLLQICSKQLEEMLEKTVKHGNPIDIKEMSTRFTTDVIGNCAFGVDCNSLQEEDNEFQKYAYKVLRTKTFKDILRRLLTISFPKLLTVLKIYSMEADCQQFYMGMVKNIIDYRERNNVNREDFINTMLLLKKGEKVCDGENNKVIADDNANLEANKLTIKEIAGQCFLFFVAGFETSSAAITFTLFELSRHLQIQEKLRKEIFTVLQQCNGELTYQAVTHMDYLDRVIAETLRKYPSLPLLNRQCTQDYVIPGTNITIEKGTSVYIPSRAIHLDGEYYPCPEAFDPERFTEENKAKRHPYTYLSFGEGPRICIGMRIGLLQVKMGLITILKNYRVTLNPQTKLPLVYDSSIMTQIVDKLWIDAVKISN